MIIPKQADVGRCVVYFSRRKPSTGVITSIINRRVFVRLRGKRPSLTSISRKPPQRINAARSSRNGGRSCAIGPFFYPGPML